MCNLFPFSEDIDTSLNTSLYYASGLWGDGVLRPWITFAVSAQLYGPWLVSVTPCLVIDIGYLLKSDLTARPKRFMMCGTTPAAVHCCHPAASAARYFQQAICGKFQMPAPVKRADFKPCYPAFLPSCYLTGFLFLPARTVHVDVTPPCEVSATRFAIKTHHISVRSLCWRETADLRNA